VMTVDLVERCGSRLRFSGGFVDMGWSDTCPCICVALLGCLNLLGFKFWQPRERGGSFGLSCCGDCDSLEVWETLRKKVLTKGEAFTWS